MRINDLNEFQIETGSKRLGEGTFSEVFKVRSLADGKFYALKAVPSKDQRKLAFPARQAQLGQ